jgi:DNA mismatch endonuclease (patch repair protein)
MAQVSQRDTAPELAVRRLAYAMGLRYTMRNRDLPGSPDLANRSKKWAIFVHGCYWHRHTKCHYATVPKTNTLFWMRKFERNRQRDLKAVRILCATGYRVDVIWECDTGNEDRVACTLRSLLMTSVRKTG